MSSCKRNVNRDLLDALSHRQTADRVTASARFYLRRGGRIWLSRRALPSPLYKMWRGRRSPDSLDKIHDTLDVFEDLLVRRIAFGGLRRQPLAIGRKQVFKGIAD